MRNLFFAFALTLIAIFGVSATVADFSATNDYQSSVTASVGGINKEFAFDTETLVAIYNLMPQDVKELCVDSYKDISARLERSDQAFTYAKVQITPIKTIDGTDLKFTYGSHSVVVGNYNKCEFDQIFSL